ncbi:c-type cytochrome [Thiomonas bhubaneswarensis]|uniref:Thiosulfate dehydrogenase n=1 Tax=Thiomonas bhubaneswarensis TaxID=339866 RepID=A0A0K6IBY2_9BURK|nr:Cytochrome c [Thiomonas bhubaneswarensis]
MTTTPAFILKPSRPVAARTVLRLGSLALALAGAGALTSIAMAAETPSAPPKSEINASVGTGAKFVPPPESSIPNDEFGKMVKLGRDIMLDTPKYAKAYVGNTLSCVNCHTDAGRMAGSAPLWAAYVSYPAYRGKNKKVNTYEERLQGCFMYSQNGKAPPLGSETLVALQSYSYWLSKGLPVDEKVAGRGYPNLPDPAQTPDYVRGQKVFEAKCAICHAADGQGQYVNGETVFPPLWGPKSFNWGAGMGSYKNAAKFIYANMPYGMSYSLTPQEAWDVAYFMDAQERPQDPRWTGTVAGTRAKFHDSKFSLYGTKMNGKLLGDIGAPKPR